MKNVCRFQFDEGVGREVVENELALAITVAECMYGQARVRLGTAYLFSESGRELVLDVSADTGEYIAQLLTGLLIRNVGEHCFRVERPPRGVSPGAGTQNGDWGPQI